MALFINYFTIWMWYVDVYSLKGPLREVKRNERENHYFWLFFVQAVVVVPVVVLGVILVFGSGFWCYGKYNMNDKKLPNGGLLSKNGRKSLIFDLVRFCHSVVSDFTAPLYTQLVKNVETVSGGATPVYSGAGAKVHYQSESKKLYIYINIKHCRV